MSLPRRAALLSALLTLGLPAAAHAATWTVDPALDRSGACADQRCPTIQKAVDAAAAGDTVLVLKGTFAESPTVGKALTIRGAGSGDSKVTGAGTGDVFTLTAADTTLAALGIEVPADAGSAVRVDGANAMLDGIVATRQAASSKNEPLVDVVGSARVLNAFLVQGAGATTALTSSGTGGVQVADSLLLSATGHAVQLTASDRNTIQRATIASLQPDSDAIRFAAASAGDKKLVADSSVLVGGATNGAGLRATTSGTSAQTLTIVGRHLTVAGAKNGVVIDSSGAGALLPPAVGNIDATFTASIVHGASSAGEYTTNPLTRNNAKLTLQSSDGPPATGDGEITQPQSNTPDDQLFAPKGLKLRGDAPLIDKGGAPAGDESQTDVDKEPRVNGGASDVGADEFHNRAPKALFGITDKNPRAGSPVGFISGSTDPEQEAGGGIVEYRWDFGDGTRKTTTDLGVVHTYAQVGTYQATLQVKDRQGALSEVTPAQTVTVRDGTAPVLTILAPAAGQVVKLVKKRLPLTVLGKWEDASGVQSIEVAVQLVKRDRVKKKKARRKRASSSQTAKCEFYSGRLLARNKRCDRPIWLPAAIQGNGFAIVTRKGLRLPAGLYEIRVRGVDAQGNPSAAPAARDRSLVRFRVK